MTRPAPVGLLGGTFDPIHYAHLRLAEEAADVLGLAQVRFIPAAIPPHRGAPQASAEHRRAMVGIAIGDNSRFVLDDRELQRQGRSYTFDTLAGIRDELGECPLCLLMGADAFVALTTWHRWSELFSLAHIVIANRPGYRLDELDSALPHALKAEYLQRHSNDHRDLARAPAGRIVTHELTAMDVSATALRESIRLGRSLRYLLPDDVIAYIRQHHLYKEHDAL
ncbi:MAG: nicotinate-nucleotide adenylyltransferase [Burkholderiales bacterium]